MVYEGKASDGRRGRRGAGGGEQEEVKPDSLSAFSISDNSRQYNATTFQEPEVLLKIYRLTVLLADVDWISKSCRASRSPRGCGSPCGGINIKSIRDFVPVSARFARMSESETNTLGNYRGFRAVRRVSSESNCNPCKGIVMLDCFQGQRWLSRVALLCYARKRTLVFLLIENEIDQLSFRLVRS